jgi:RNA polymerase sigma-70 factor (sigma-E family)
VTQLPEAALDRSTRPQPRALRSVQSADSVEAAIGILFRRQYPILLRIAYALLGTREGAEDAVQDAFVSLFHNWNRLRDPEAAEAYVRAAVLNRCRSRVRTRIRDRLQTSRDPVVEPHAVGSDEVAVSREDAALVGAALRELPRRQREVVTCRYLLELTVAETAEALGISGGAVKRHAHRGLRALHTALEVTR